MATECVSESGSLWRPRRASCWRRQCARVQKKKSGSAGESAPSRHMKMSINTFLPLLRREKIVTEASEGLLLMTHSAELASLTGGQACYSYAPSRV